MTDPQTSSPQTVPAVPDGFASPEAAIRAFATAEDLPRAALQWCIDHRDEATPFLLAVVERNAGGIAIDEIDEDALFYAIHLLAQFGEQRACRPFATILAFDRDRLDRLLGDAVTATLSNLMAALFDGDLEPLERLVAAPGVDPYVKWNLFETLAWLARIGRADVAEVERILIDSYDRLAAGQAEEPWAGWIVAAAAMATPELIERGRRAFHDGLFPEEFQDLGHFENDIKAMAESAEAWRTLLSVRPFDDTIGTFETWAGMDRSGADHVSREAAGTADALELEPLLDALRTGRPDPLDTVINPYRHVGRNDPCPCGSGKKFKKCCFDKV